MEIIRATKWALDLESERNKKLEAELEDYKEKYEELSQEHKKLKNCYTEKEMKEL